MGSGRKVIIQTVTTPMASPVSCIRSSWSVLLSEKGLLQCTVPVPQIYFYIFAIGLQRPINASNAVTLAHQVRTYTLEAAGFTDSVDVLYVAQLMEKFMEYVRQLREVRKLCIVKSLLCCLLAHPSFRCKMSVWVVSQLSEVLVEMGSNLMQVDDQILTLAQREKRACSLIVYSLEMLAWPQLHSHAQDFSMVCFHIAIFFVISSLAFL